ncbi:hypothetical protein KCV07_g860, partial [Aureobasidium melanogenum]
MVGITDMPTEIRDEILSLLPLQDARNVSRSISSGAFDGSYNHRSSIASYLATTFGNGEHLLDVMSRHCVYISGSRALEFFVPGTIDVHSDWDFYVPRNEATISSFMLELDKMGVEWTGSLDKLEMALEFGTGDIFFAWEQYRYLYDRGTFRKLARKYSVGDATTPHRDERLNAQAGDFVVVTVTEEGLGHGDESSSYSSRADEVDHMEYTRFGRVLNGYLTTPNGKTKVQLIIEPRSYQLSTPGVMHYHSTCVQSVIGPHMACHFYGKLSSARRSYAWRLDEPRISKAHAKYKSRGFVYVDREADTFCMRSGEDGFSILVPRQGITRAPAAVVQLYTEYLRKTTWQEFAHHVRPLPYAVPHYMPSEDALSTGWFNRGNGVRVRRALVEKGILPYFDFVLNGNGDGDGGLWYPVDVGDADWTHAARICLALCLHALDSSLWLLTVSCAEFLRWIFAR